MRRCVDHKRMTVADRFVASPAQRAADECAVFGRPPVRRMRYLRACPAVTRFAIMFAGRPLSKNHRCCPDTAGCNAPKSWADIFHGSPASSYVKHPLSRKVLRFLPAEHCCGVELSENCPIIGKKKLRLGFAQAGLVECFVYLCRGRLKAGGSQPHDASRRINTTAFLDAES